MKTDFMVEVGDRLVIKSHRNGEPDRDGKILEIHGEAGTPPYLVEWSEDGHVGLVFPGPDAIVEHYSHNGESTFISNANGDLS